MQGRRANEVLRPVRLTKAFYLGVREVTNAEFRAFKSEHKSGEFGGKTLDEGDQPVVRVTPEEAMQYLNWLSITRRSAAGLRAKERRVGRGPAAAQRLPTADRGRVGMGRALRGPATNGLLYPWGADWPPPDRSGNWADVSARSMLPTTMVTYNDGFPVSAPAGTFDAESCRHPRLGQQRPRVDPGLLRARHHGEREARSRTRSGPKPASCTWCAARAGAA